MKPESRVLKLGGLVVDQRQEGVKPEMVPGASGLLGWPGRLRAISQERTAAHNHGGPDGGPCLDTALREQMLASATEAVNALCSCHTMSRRPTLTHAKSTC